MTPAVQAVAAERTGAFSRTTVPCCSGLRNDPEIRLVDVARDVGISQRAAQMILRDLVAGGFVTRRRVGRRNRYQIHASRHLRPGGRLRVSDLLDLLPADHAWRAKPRSRAAS